VAVVDLAGDVELEAAEGFLLVLPAFMRRRLADQVGTTARLHDLRHLQAGLLLDAGEAITTVAARLGHRDMATTRCVCTRT
jgi:integrase